MRTNVPVFSVYGEFYLVGYGASAAPLEAWAAEWPIYVISQVYIDGTGAGRSYLDATGAKEYDGTNTSGYDGEIKNFDSVLAALGISERMKKSDVPVPTWFIGYDENDYSITYWKQANDAIATTEAGVISSEHQVHRSSDRVCKRNSAEGAAGYEVRYRSG